MSNHRTFKRTTILNEVREGETVEVENGNLTIGGRVGRDATIIQRGKGRVFIGAGTDWNVTIDAEGDIEGVSFSYNNKIKSRSGNITARQGFGGSNKVEAKNGTVAGQDALSNCKITAREVRINEVKGDNVRIRELGREKGRIKSFVDRVKNCGHEERGQSR